MADTEGYGDSNGAEQQYEEAPEGQEYEQQQYEETPEQGAGDAEGDGDKINASKNDDDDRKIFVGGLSWETTIKDLREYFAKYGEVVDCTLKTDHNTGRSRGFGFVLFASSEAVDKVCEEQTHTLHGKTIDPKRAKARGGKEPIKKVFIGGLDPEFPESQLRDHFSQFGKIEEIDLPFDKVHNKRRAFCFITFESEEVVDKVCLEAKQKLGDKEVDVKKATPKQDHYGGRGGYSGDRGFGGGRGRGGRGRGRGGYNQGWGNGYNQGGYNQGYGNNDYYNQGYGNYDYSQGYGNYDYSGYYGNQGWGNYNQGGYGGYGGGYGSGYDYSGWGYGNNQQGGSGGGNQQGGGGYKAKSGGRGNNSGGYHPYSR